MKQLDLFKLNQKQIKRFESKIIKTNECWIWSGWKNKRGYGKFYLNKKDYAAHRVSLWIFKKFNQKLNVLHSCNNTSCVNPNHLRPGTQKDNYQDIFKAKNCYWKNKKTCIKGHKFNKKNTKYYIGSNGNTWRECKICKKLRYNRSQHVSRI